MDVVAAVSAGPKAPRSKSAPTISDAATIRKAMAGTMSTTITRAYRWIMSRRSLSRPATPVRATLGKATTATMLASIIGTWPTLAA